MKYNLKAIDDFINENWGEESEVENIVKEIRDTAIGLRTEEATKLFLQKHQIALHKIKSKAAFADNSDKVLYFLETFFGKFLESSFLVSNLGKEALYKKHETTILEAENLLKPLLDYSLWIQFYSSLNPRIAKCTIARCDYLNEFWESWTLDFGQFNNQHDEDSLIRFLISQNFNSPSFYQYILNKITDSIDNDGDPVTQRKILEIYQRKYCLVSPCEKRQYNTDFRSIFHLVNDWLNAAIKNCRKRQKDFDPNQTTFIASNGQPTKKIQATLSVEEIACLFKMLKDVGAISNEKNTEVFEVVSNSFRAKKAESIAPGSFKNNFYEIKDKTWESVRDTLRQMLKLSK